MILSPHNVQDIGVGQTRDLVVDPWRDCVYAFERAARASFEPEHPPMLTLTACAVIVDRAFSRYQHMPLYPVSMTDGRGRRVGGLKCGTDRSGQWHFVIMLPCARRRPWCALHEAAHVITWGDEHGWQFSKCLIDLWGSIGGWPANELHRLAEIHGVPVEIEE